MSVIKITRCDLFPVGTVVGLYLRGAGHQNSEHGAPSPGKGPEGTVLPVNATVASNGTVEWTGVEAGVEYEAAASVGGSYRQLIVASDAFAEPGTLKERLAVRRSESGAGLAVIRVDEPTSPSSVKAPVFTGFASDTTAITVKIYAGSAASGSVASTATATGERSWTSSAASPALTAGTYTAVAEQESTLNPNPPTPNTVSDPVTFVVT